jgi:hypothetical protein
MATTWKSIIATVAPALATALGGPLAGVAVKTIADKVLGRPDATPSDVETAILSGTTPELLLKLKQADQDFAKAMAEAGIALEKLETEDRASARAMQVATRDWVPGVLAMIFVVGFFSLLYALTRVQIPVDNREVLIAMVGTMGGAVMTVLTFYFGSSKSSQNKDAVLGRVAEGK